MGMMLLFIAKTLINDKQQTDTIWLLAQHWAQQIPKPPRRCEKFILHHSSNVVRTSQRRFGGAGFGKFGSRGTFQHLPLLCECWKLLGGCGKTRRSRQGLVCAPQDAGLGNRVQDNVSVFTKEEEKNSPDFFKIKTWRKTCQNVLLWKVFVWTALVVYRKREGSAGLTASPFLSFQTELKWTAGRSAFHRLFISIS